MKPFVHLHTHSHYSLLDGLSQLDEMIKTAKGFEMPALAVTDHGNLYAAIEFYKAAKKASIKPIIGVEAYVAERTRFDKEPNIDARRYHLTLLAKNFTGYKNLLKLVTKSHLEGFYYKPRMDHDLLREHAEGIICLSGCFSSELSRAFRNKQPEKAREVVALYQSIFGKENYFLEVMHHPGVEGLLDVRKEIVALGRELGIPIVATQDSHYMKEGDTKAHETLLAINTGADSNDENRFSMSADKFYFKSGDEMAEALADLPEAVENTIRVANMCDLEIPLGNWVFPHYEVPKGSNHAKELEKITYAGLETRDLKLTALVKERIEHELKVINDKGYAPYFLIVADLIRFAEENKIFTNIRGSVAGSIVTYLTGITKINPLEYQLPFERFLNPDRPSAPDIDMDFADNRRDEVIEYAVKKYGADRVAQVGTFGTMLARGVVRDVARALGKPYAIGDRISKLIPMGSQGFPMTIAHALELEPELKKIYETEAEAKEIIDLGRRLEGCARHVSVHAAGVVMAPEPLTEYTPLQLDPKGGKIITQYDMYAVDDVGLLKFDFLGIRNLSILADAVERVKKIRGLDLDIEKVPLDDKKTFQMLAHGDTMGVFQLGGSGMTRYLKDLKPTTIHDINVMIALYRPGPMNNIDEYIARKHGKAEVKYLHPKMKDFLERTYGVLVYQDDLLMTAIEVAGYSWSEVDKFRKAVGKKIPEEMAKQHVEFVEGCIKHGGMSKQKAEELWNLFEPFQGYGFNKAHAASYGLVAYQTAYMKANFPAEYMTAVLTAESGDMEKVSEVIPECKRMGFEVLPPDVNESFSDFTVVRNEKNEVTKKIRFGLRSIKNFGEEIGKAIIHERKGSGPYMSFANFLERVKHKNLNKKSLEALIMSGAMDSFGERGQLLANLDQALEYNREIAGGPSNQSSLFGLMDQSSVPTFKLKLAEAATLGQKLAWEKDLLGLYISGHPLERFKDKFDRHEQTVEKIKTLGNRANVVVAGILDEVKTTLTKNGGKMVFGKLSDFSGSIEIVAFNDAYEEFKDLFFVGKCVALRGSISHRNGAPSIVVDKVKALEEETVRST